MLTTSRSFLRHKERFQVFLKHFFKFVVLLNLIFPTVAADSFYFFPALYYLGPQRNHFGPNIFKNCENLLWSAFRRGGYNNLFIARGFFRYKFRINYIGHCNSTCCNKHRSNPFFYESWIKFFHLTLKKV